MAGAAPKTRNWHALENKHEPAELHLIVSGEVGVSATNKRPQLAEAPHVGNVLPLDLTIVDAEDDQVEEIEVWMPASLHRMVSANEFDRVQIRWDGRVIATVPVLDDAEHDALAAKQTQAQNKVAKVVTRKPAAKKVVTRVVAAVEDAVGDLAKGAGKVLDKVFKKAAKKSTKKTIKKSTRKATKAVAKKRTKKTRKSAKKASRPVKKPARKVTRKATKKAKAPPKKAKKSKRKR